MTTSMPPLTNDILFRHVFGCFGGEYVLAALLNALLERSPDKAFVHAYPLNPGLGREHIDEMGAIVELEACDFDGETTRIQVQLGREGPFMERATYHLTRMYGDQPAPTPSRCSLVPVVVVCLLDHVIDPERPKVHRVLMFTGDVDGDVLTEDLQIHIFELPTADTEICRVPSTPMELWLRLLLSAHEFVDGADKLPRRLRKEPGVALLVDRLQSAAGDEELMTEARYRQRDLRARAAVLRQAKAEASMRIRRDLARQMLLQGCAVSLVKDVTYLTDEEITTLGVP